MEKTKSLEPQGIVSEIPEEKIKKIDLEEKEPEAKEEEQAEDEFGEEFDIPTFLRQGK